MNIRNSGFVFVATLLTITVITLLVLSSMQQLVVLRKALIAIDEQNKQISAMEEVMSQLKSTALDSCTTSAKTANQVVEELSKKGCSSHHHYRYLVQNLSDFPCSVVFFKGKKYSAQFRRISLTDMDNPELVLQVMQINPSNYQECRDRELELRLGVASWRYLRSR